MIELKLDRSSCWHWQCQWPPTSKNQGPRPGAPAPAQTPSRRRLWRRACHCQAATVPLAVAIAAWGTGPISDSGAGYYPATLGAGLVRAALRRCRGHHGLCGPAPELSALRLRLSFRAQLT
jgi:hypothetical protein